MCVRLSATRRYKDQMKKDGLLGSCNIYLQNGSLSST